MLKVNKIQLLQYQKYYKVCHVLIRPPLPRPPSPVPWIRDQELFYLVNVSLLVKIIVAWTFFCHLMRHSLPYLELQIFY